MIEFTAGTEKNADRRTNEDRIWISAAGNACAVFDGSGADGAIAGIAMQEFQRELEQLAEVTNADVLVRALRRVNQRILREVQEDERLRSAGSTLDLIAFGERRLVALHVGDGRIYRLREGTLEQLSSDHTWVAEQVLAGELSADEARSHPRANVLMRALTGGSVVPEILHSDLQPGDRVIACTDGVWRAVDDDTLRAFIMAMPTSVGALESIFHRAEASHDNASIIVATVS